MKKIFLACLGLIAAISFTSCDVEDEINKALGDLLEFNFDLDESFTVPPLTTSAPGTEISPAQKTNQTVGPFDTGIADFLGKNNLNAENLESITVSELKLKTDKDFNAIESIQVSVGNVIIGSIDAIPANAQEILLTPDSSQNLKDIINKEEISFNVELFIKEVITDGLDVDIESSFKVKGRVNL